MQYLARDSQESSPTLPLEGQNTGIKKKQKQKKPH